MYRSYVFKAWVDTETAPMLIEQGQRLMRAYAQACKIEDLNEGRQFLYKELGDLWYASRQMTATWLKGQHARRFMKRKPRPEDEDAGIGEQVGYDGVLGGLFGSTEVSWGNFTKRSDRYRVFCKTISDGKKPMLELTMPVWTEKKKDLVKVRFLMHRPIGNDVMVHRYHILMRPKKRNCVVIGYAFYVSLMLKVDNPEERRPRRMGTLQPAWKVEADGSILVLVLEIEYLDGTKVTHQYHLPPGTIKRGRRAQHLSMTGQDNVEYRNFERWRLDLYRKIATDVCKRADALKTRSYNSAAAIPGTIPRHRPLVSAAKLIMTISQKAKATGVMMLK